MSTEQICQLCGSPMTHVFTARVLTRYDAKYFRCPHCEFLRTEKPYWLEEAYSRAIAATDTGIVVRNLKIAGQLTCVLPRFFKPGARYLDVAGGTGLLTRLMRDSGFDFYTEDRHCDNVMAFGFDGEPGAARYDAVTAFEALEHMEQPLEFILDCLERSSSGTFIFSTELFPSPIPRKEWWYFSLATGQHIAFYSKFTFERLAEKLQLNFQTSGGLHMLSRRPIAPGSYRRALSQAEGRHSRRDKRTTRGLTDSDHEAMTARILRAGSPNERGATASTDFSFDASGEVLAASAVDETSGAWWRRTAERLRRRRADKR